MSETTAVCAHLVVRYETEQMADGGTRGWWACKDCGTSFGPRPAARPGGEGTPTEPWCCADCGVVMQNEDSAWAHAHARGHMVRKEPRSPAPASGAPGEERKGVPADQFRAVMLKAVEELGFHGLRPTDEAIASLASVIANASRLGWEVDRADYESRLAAAERAGVALREALQRFVDATDENAAEGEHGAFIDECQNPRCVAVRLLKAAALTPTGSAPSPEERADG